VQAGFLGNLVSAEPWSDGEALHAKDAGAGVPPEDAEVPRLFLAQQQHLSLSQMREYNDHSKAGEELDEDFEGNFS